MFLNKDSILINGVSVGQYLLADVDFDYNKLWSSKSGRNMAGTQVRNISAVYFQSLS